MSVRKGIAYASVCLIALALCVLPKPLRVGADTFQGTGDTDDPYQIYDCDDLQAIDTFVPPAPGAMFKLMNDIDCTMTPAWNDGAGFVPLGTTALQETNGSETIQIILDGNFKTIYGLTIDDLDPDSYGVGLFAQLNETLVYNLTLSGGSITGGNITGSLAGFVSDAIVGGVKSTGMTVTATDEGGFFFAAAGGLVGLETEDLLPGQVPSIDRSSAADTVTVIDGDNDLDVSGGLVGFVSSASIGDSYSTSTVSGGAFSGGLAGVVSGSFESGASVAAVYDSYAGGAVDGEELASGGLIGDLENDPTSVSSSFSVAHLVGDSQATGGIAGLMDYSTTTPPVDPDTDFFDASPSVTPGGLCVGTESSPSCVAVDTGADGDSTDTTYFLGNAMNGPFPQFDFNDVWQTVPGALPVLRADYGVGFLFFGSEVAVSDAEASAGNSQGEVTWQTDNPADSQVLYGTTTAYGSSTPVSDDAQAVTSHDVTITGLNSCTTYHYQAVSRDNFNNIGTSTDGFFTTAGCAADATLDQGLVSWWPLDEIGGALANDYSGNGNDGVVHGSAQWGPGASGNALSFNGSTHIRVSRPVSGDMTLCALIQTTGVGNGTDHWTTMPIFDSEMPDARNDFGFGVDSNGDLAFGDGGEDDVTVNSSVAVNDGNWHYVCATRKQSSGDIALYIDGAADETGVGDTNLLDGRPDAEIGAGFDGAANFQGSIDDLRIYDRVLSPSQMASLYDQHGDADLVTYWKLNDYSGATASDSSGYGNPGTVSGTAGWDDGIFDFDGSTTIAGSDDSLPAASSSRSFFVWVKTGNTAEQAISAYGGGEGGNALSLDEFSIGSGGTSLYLNGGSDDAHATVPALDDDAWHYIGYTYGGGTGVTFYVDGAPYSSTLPQELDTIPGGAFVLGGYVSQGGNLFSGQMSDARVYSAALSLDIEQGLYASGTVFDGGDGTLGTPYLIGSCAELQNMAVSATADYALEHDIDCSATPDWDGGHGFSPIGAYYGTFDGRGHVIRDLSILHQVRDGIQEEGDENNVGLFGTLQNGAVIENAALQGGAVRGDGYVGGLAGVIQGTSAITIRNAGVDGMTVAGGGNVGGLLGAGGNANAAVEMSSSSASVSGETGIGGLVGYAGHLAVIDSTSTASVEGDSSIGGLVGWNDSGGSISGSVSSSIVSGNAYVGVLVGYNQGSIADSYAAQGSVDGAQNIGGLVGQDYSSPSHDVSAVTNSFYNADAVEVGGAHRVTDYGIYGDQFLTWRASSLTPFSVSGIYGSTDQNGFYDIGSAADLIHILPLVHTDLTAYKFKVTAPGSVTVPAEFYIPNMDAEFDGNGVTIHGLAVHQPQNSQLGLFGTVSGTVENVLLPDASVEGDEAVGSIVGELESGSISDSSATGTMVVNSFSGGFAGSVDQGTSIERSHAAVDVTAGSPSSDGFEIGGFAGYVDGAISTSTSSGSLVEGSGDSDAEYIGGFAGYADSDSVINGSSATGDVTMAYDGASEVGGFAGDTDGAISGSHAAGDVAIDGEDGEYLGGFAGGVDEGSIADSYATGNVTDAGGGASFLGGFAGYMDIGASGSHAAGDVTGIGGDFNIGGFAGWTADVPITSSYAIGDVTGNQDVGGFVGACQNQAVGGTFAAIFAAGDVTGVGYSPSSVGGLMGYDSCPVQDAYATGRVSLGQGSTGSPTLFGGLIGSLDSLGSLVDAYASGEVYAPGTYQVGGLIGQDQSQAAPGVLNSFSVGHVIGGAQSGGLVGEEDDAALSNDAWYTGAAANAIGFDAALGPSVQALSAAGYGTDAATTSVFFSTSSPVYAAGGPSAWDFSTLWVPRAGALPTFAFSVDAPAHDTDGSGSGGDGGDPGSDNSTPPIASGISVSSSGSSGGYINLLSLKPNPLCPASLICVPIPGYAASAAPAVPSVKFTADLQVGSSGPAVTALQKYLNGRGFVIASSGAGSPGHETALFGLLTKSALAKFQLAHGISATGFFGPITRAYVDSHK